MTSTTVRRAIEPFWAATGDGDMPPVVLSGDVPPDRAAFRTGLAAAAAAGAVGAAVAELTAGQPPPLDPDLALASFTTHVRQDGRAIPKWAALSGAYRTADGRYIQLHCNFAHHARGTAQLLGVPEESAAVETAVGDWEAEALEQALIGQGLVAAAYRTLEEWAAHPHAMAVADLPLVGWSPLAPPEEELDWLPRRDTAPHLPLAGVRVLDLSRVLAGPVAGQTLANLGAEVLRVDAPHLPSVDIGVMSTGTGKRNTSLDLRSADARTQLVDLLRDADLFIDAYRPGALERWGFGPHEIAAVAPQTCVVQISAFDWVGPWAGRRGFDSIVQSATGVALAGAAMCGSDIPVHLPVQALDYSTGLFAAAAAIRALRRRAAGHGSTLARLSLIRTRNWLMTLGGPRAFEPAPINPAAGQVATIDSDFGPLELVKPFVGRWAWGPRHLRSAPPRWLS